MCLLIRISTPRLLEERNREIEIEKEETERRLEELEHEMKQIKRLQQTESEAKNKLRQETSRLTAENMVCVCVLFFPFSPVYLYGSNIMSNITN